MRLIEFFRRRSDGRMEPRKSAAEIERELSERFALRKAARLEKNPHKRGWLTRKLNEAAR